MTNPDPILNPNIRTAQRHPPHDDALHSAQRKPSSEQIDRFAALFRRQAKSSSLQDGPQKDKDSAQAALPAQDLSAARGQSRHGQPDKRDARAGAALEKTLEGLPLALASLAQALLEVQSQTPLTPSSQAQTPSTVAQALIPVDLAADDASAAGTHTLESAFAPAQTVMASSAEGCLSVRVAEGQFSGVEIVVSALSDREGKQNKNKKVHFTIRTVNDRQRHAFETIQQQLKEAGSGYSLEVQ